MLGIAYEEIEHKSRLRISRYCLQRQSFRVAAVLFTVLLAAGLVAEGARNIQLRYENLALFVILLIMIVLVVFSLGVERGKRIAIKNMRLWATAHANKKAEETQLQGRGEEFDVKAADLSVKPYTIQIMAVKKIEEAQREAARLNGMGYKAFIIQTCAWYHVCAGRYANAADINNDLPVIKEKYPNCYVRKIRE
mgnify:CR=1 FL=1